MGSPGEHGRVVDEQVDERCGKAHSDKHHSLLLQWQ